MNILITGAAGFVGKNLTAALEAILGLQLKPSSATLAASRAPGPGEEGPCVPGTGWSAV